MINIAFNIKGDATGKLLTTPKCYRLWEKIVSFHHEELTNELIWLFSNITPENNEVGYDILNSTVLNKYLLSFLEEKLNPEDLTEKNLEKIERATCLLCNLLQDDDEKKNINIQDIKKRIFKIFIKFLDVDNKNIFLNILRGFETQKKSLVIYLDILEEANIFEKLIKKTKNVDLVVRMYSNRVVGNYLSFKNVDKLDLEFINLLLNFESDNLEQEVVEIRKESAWSLSNMAIDSSEITKLIVNHPKIIEELINLAKKEERADALAEIMICLSLLVVNSNFNDFFTLMNHYLFPILIDGIKKLSSLPFSLPFIFQAIFKSLQYGETIRNQKEQNCILNKFIELGGYDILEKYQNTQDVQLYQCIQAIMSQFFNGKSNEIIVDEEEHINNN